MRIICNNASTTISVTGGTVGIGTDTNADVATLSSVGVEGSGTATIGRGITYASATNNGGTLMSLAAPSGTIKTIAGNTSLYGTAQIPSLYCMGGITSYNARNATSPFVDIGDLYAWGGTLDFTGDARPTIIGNYHRRAGSGFSQKFFSDTQPTISNTIWDLNGQTETSDN